MIEAAFAGGTAVRFGVYCFTESLKRSFLSSRTLRRNPLICDDGIMCDLMCQAVSSIFKVRGQSRVALLPQDGFIAGLKGYAITWSKVIESFA